TEPVPSTATTTAFGSTAPADAKFTDDVSGSGDPHGHTRNHPAAAGSTAVTFNATPATPDPGTPNRPNTGTCNGTPGNTVRGETPAGSGSSRSRRNCANSARPVAVRWTSSANQPSALEASLAASQSST